MNTTNDKTPNNLIKESSPYLLQHAYNPVNWFGWNEEALQKAKKEDKPILISIGYSACHWCHVMERESFEDDTTAAIMNKNFVCIKVDREERPDLDHIYMEAVQTLTGQGGWPLNMFLTPDAKPFYGGTYFPPQPAHGRPSWTQVLNGVAQSFKTNRIAIEEQAEKLTQHIKQTDKVHLKKQAVNIALTNTENYLPALEKHYLKLQTYYDKTYGGFGSAPKFPHTSNILFLLRKYYYEKHENALQFALFTLTKMLNGGIYDQIGGGFARYSTDSYWLAPHFEKMLYDNAQLLQAIAEAYAITKDNFYAESIAQTFQFLQRELVSEEGGYYAALDADSEGIEGKFYVWQKQEIETLLKEDATWFCEYFNVTENGNWEHTNILNRNISAKEYAQQKNVSYPLFQQKLNNCINILLAERNKRIRPGLDDKILLGWNALMAKGLAAAYEATANEDYKSAAIRNINFLLEKFVFLEEEKIYHTYKNGRATYLAYLDDIASLIDALLAVYQISFNTNYLNAAKAITEFAIKYFLDVEQQIFLFTSSQQNDIIIRKAEVYDSVVPSGNSQMANNLLKLAIIFDNNEYRKLSETLLAQLQESIEKYPLSFGNWAILMQAQHYGIKEIALVGKDCLHIYQKIMQHYIPEKIIMASEKENNDFVMLQGKPAKNETIIYICEQNVCHTSTKNIEEALNKLL
jgi:uncharacterized protein YyaL (SSP411 family)